MKFKVNDKKLPWYEELACWIGSIMLLPITIPLVFAALFFGMAMIIFDKINDGFGH